MFVCYTPFLLLIAVLITEGCDGCGGGGKEEEDMEEEAEKEEDAEKEEEEDDATASAIISDFTSCFDSM